LAIQFGNKVSQCDIELLVRIIPTDWLIPGKAGRFAA
jgi:hypothetical protein